ncbi:MAG: HEAT repeat domain-containing protein [Terracidiphilus sp.]
MKPSRSFICRSVARRGLRLSLSVLFWIGFAGALGAQTAPDNVTLQIARLKSPNVELRRYAADALAKFGDPRATQPLIAALGDPDPQVRANAAMGLGRMKSPAAVDALIHLLNDPDEIVSSSAAMALANSQDPRAIAPLVAALPSVTTASTALLQLGPAVVEPLLAAAEDADPDVRKRALEALALTHDPRAIPALTAALNDSELEVRQGALYSLQTLKAPNFLEALRAALKSPDTALRAVALRASGELPIAESIPIVIAAMHDPDPSIRNAAAVYLKPTQTADPQVAEALIALAQDPDSSVSWGAVNTLATSRDPKAIDAMLGFAQGKNPHVDPHQAIELLGKVQDPRAFALLTDSLRSTDLQMATIAAEQLGDLRDARAVPALAAAAKANVPAVASDAIVSLGKIGSPAVDALIGLLNQPGLQNATIGALGNTHDPRAVPALLAMLATPYRGTPQPYGAAITQTADDLRPVRPMTYSALLSALGQLGDPRAVAPLIDYLKNGPVGRNLVPQELASLGSASIEPLIPLLHDSNENTRRLAAEALSDLAIKQQKDLRPHDALVAAIGNHDIAIMAGAYQFYVSLGAPGTENDLVAALGRFPDQGMAEYFLNCGSVALEDAAIAWGQKIHYHITQQVYGIAWGQMPKPAD